MSRKQRDYKVADKLNSPVSSCSLAAVTPFRYVVSIEKWHMLMYCRHMENWQNECRMLSHRNQTNAMTTSCRSVTVVFTLVVNKELVSNRIISSSTMLVLTFIVYLPSALLLFLIVWALWVCFLSTLTQPQQTTFIPIRHHWISQIRLEPSSASSSTIVYSFLLIFSNLVLQCCGIQRANPRNSLRSVMSLQRAAQPRGFGECACI